MLESDVEYHSRSIYSPLDFIGDIGGFSDAVGYIGALVMWLTKSKSIVTFLMTHLFKKVGNHMEELDLRDSLRAREKLRPHTCLSSLCPRLRRWTAIEREAERRIEHELDILT